MYLSFSFSTAINTLYSIKSKKTAFNFQEPSLGIIVPVVTASNRSVEDTLEPMLRSGRSSYQTKCDCLNTSFLIDKAMSYVAN
jgi:hypothetical protein